MYTEKQKRINSELETKLQNAACNESIACDFSHTNTDLKNRILYHNSVAANICKMVSEYNENCRKERKQLSAKK